MSRWMAVLLVAWPVTVSAQSHDLYVSSRNTHAVVRFDGVTGAYVEDFVPSGEGGLSTTQEVAFGPDGHLYVSGRGNTAILRYDGATGAFLGPFTHGYELDNPTKMTFGPDGLYVSQWGEEQSTVAVFDTESGAFLREATPDLEMGMQHAWDADGTLYVSSYGTKDVRRYDGEGRLIDVFAGPEHLRSAVNLWFGEDGDLFVVDWEAGSVVRFDGRTGAFEGVFIEGLSRAEGFAIGPDGALYVNDWQENEIHRYDATTGEHLGVFAEGGGMQQPNGLAFGPGRR